MIKIGTAILVLCATAVCAAQVSTTAAQGAAMPAKHYRLTFALTYPDGREPAQSLVLDVPVLPDRPGMGGVNTAAGPTGQVEGSVQQSLQYTDVRQTASGLAGSVSFSRESVSQEPLPGSTEHMHQRFAFEKKFDVEMAKPTRISDEMHVVPLGKAAGVGKPPSGPKIVVTATEI